MYIIYNVAKSINRGGITIFTDNKKIADDCNKEFNKTTEYAIEGARLTCEIKRLIKKTLVISRSRNN